MDRAFIDDVGCLLFYQKPTGFVRFDGMAEKVDWIPFHPIFTPIDIPDLSKCCEITLDKAHDILDRYWVEQVESVYRLEI